MYENVNDEQKRAALENDMQLFRYGLDQIIESMRTLLCAKRASYGPGNLLLFKEYGILVRMGDKFMRLSHMYENGMANTAVGEDIRDAWRDICGYSLLALMFLEYGDNMLPSPNTNALLLEMTDNDGDTDDVFTAARKMIERIKTMQQTPSQQEQETEIAEMIADDDGMPVPARNETQEPNTLHGFPSVVHNIENMDFIDGSYR